MRWPAFHFYYFSFLVILCFIVYDEPRRNLSVKPNVDTSKCKWVAWRKTNVCPDDNVRASGSNIPIKPAGSSMKQTVTQTKINSNPISRDGETHPLFKVITNTQPKPLGYAWRVAVLYHGHYDRRGSRLTDGPSCSDFFLNEANHNQMIFDPLRQVLNASVEIFFHTYRHDTCKEKDEALVAHLKPVSYGFSPPSASKSTRVVDSYVNVLDLAIAYSDAESKVNLPPPLKKPVFETVSSAQPPGYFLIKENDPFLPKSSYDPRSFRQAAPSSPEWGAGGKSSGSGHKSDDDSEGSSAPVAREKLPLAFFHGHRLSEEAPAALVYDAIILCRFDVKYMKPLTSLPIMWGGLGVPINNKVQPNRPIPMPDKPHPHSSMGNKPISMSKPSLSVREVQGTQCLGVHGWQKCTGQRRLLPFFNFFSSKSTKESQPDLTSLDVPDPVEAVDRHRSPFEQSAQSPSKPNPFQKPLSPNKPQQKPINRKSANIMANQRADNQRADNRHNGNNVNRAVEPMQVARAQRVPMFKPAVKTPLMTSSYLAWRDDRGQWNEKKKVSDLLFISPGIHVRALRQSLNTSPGGSTSAHFFYKKFAMSVGAANIRFIDEKRFGTSNVQINTMPKPKRHLLQSVNRDALAEERVEGTGSFIVINRSCKGKVQDAMVAKIVPNRTNPVPRCWRG